MLTTNDIQFLEALNPSILGISWYAVPIILVIILICCILFLSQIFPESKWNYNMTCCSLSVACFLLAGSAIYCAIASNSTSFIDGDIAAVQKNHPEIYNQATAEHVKKVYTKCYGSENHRSTIFNTSFSSPGNCKRYFFYKEFLIKNWDSVSQNETKQND